MSNPLIGTMINNLLEREGRAVVTNTVSSCTTHPVRLNSKQEHSLKEIFLNHNCNNQGSKNAQHLSTLTIQNLESLVSKEKLQKSNITSITINLCSLEDLTPKK